MIRRRTSPALVVLALVLLVVAGAGPAQATSYRYWSFWERDGSGSAWTYATQGPATARPLDGEVQGFRFAVSADSKDSARPRRTPDFASVCARTPEREGHKRVALIIDFGTAADAPSGEKPPAPRTACARVPEDATSADALATVAKPLRYDTNALLCAIAGYPEKGCGEPVSDTGASAPPRDAGPEAPDASGDEGPSLGLFAGAGVVALLGGAAVWQARRRRG